MTGLKFGCYWEEPTPNTQEVELDYHIPHPSQWRRLQEIRRPGNKALAPWNIVLFSDTNVDGSPFPLEKLLGRNLLVEGWPQDGVKYYRSDDRYWCGDPAKPEFAAIWADAAVAKAKSIRANGIFADSVYPHYRALLGGDTIPSHPIYDGRAAWCAALAGHVTRVKTIVNAAGLKLWGNAGFTPEFLPVLDGTMWEHSFLHYDQWVEPRAIHEGIERQRACRLPVLNTVNLEATSRLRHAKAFFAICCYLIARKSDDVLLLRDHSTCWDDNFTGVKSIGKAVTLPKRGPANDGPCWSRVYFDGRKRYIVRVNVLTHAASIISEHS